MNAFLKIAVFCLAGLLGGKDSDAHRRTQIRAEQAIDIGPIKTKAAQAKTYCKTKKLNTRFFLLVDLKRHSGLKRFYVWDFEKDTLAHAFMVSHGCGNNPWAMDFSKAAAKVSNTDGSHLSSIGKYIVASRGYSNWGINVNYKLLGQDKTNSNAEKRQIVLHSWEKVPDEETYPKGTPEGWGCPALSNASMKILDEKLKTSGRTLLWVVQ